MKTNRIPTSLVKTNPLDSPTAGAQSDNSLARLWRCAIVLILLFIMASSVESVTAQTLVNGVNQTGTIFTNTLADAYTFSASAGDTINLRLATAGFSGGLELFGPNGTRVATSFGGTDNSFEYVATSSGTFTVHVSSDVANGSGTYVLRLAQTPEAFIVPAGDEGGPMTNGFNHTGIIALGDLDMWSFNANAGDTINLRLATTDFSGALELFGPNGARVDISFGGTDNNFEYKAASSGTFTVLVSADVDNGTGTYVLRLAQTPETFVVPAGDEGGPMTNGFNHTGTITLGDMDMWSFTANAGDTINLRLATTGFSGALELFGPNGARVDTSFGGTDNSFEYVATSSGTFSVLVSSDTANGTGTYVLRLAQTPETFVVPSDDEGGPMINGGNYSGTITMGDLDMWTFVANAGDTINLRLATTGFSGALELFGPNGARVDTSFGGTDNNFEYKATSSGTFTVLVSADVDNGTGTYVLRLAQAPEAFVVPAGDDGGPMTNGGNYTGTITLGDLDVWSFTANAGDTINLRLATTGFSGALELFGPNGVRVDTSFGGTDNSFEYVAASSGTFTVLISGDVANGTGTYVLRLAQTPETFVVPPDDEGGPMINGGNYQGTITLGDLDMWTFTGNTGDTINLRLATTGFSGALELFGPNGARVDTSFGGTDNNFEYKATSSGTFTVLVSSDVDNGTGTYVLRLAQAPETFIVPAGDEGGPMTNGGNYLGTITLGDLDMWTLTAKAGDTINLRLGTTGFSGALELFGPNGARVDTSFGGTDNSFEYVAASSGTFTVLISGDVANGTGNYVLRLAQTPEAFIVPAGDEGGPMTGAGQYFGTIILADMDMWSFTAFTGDVINLALNTSGFSGALELFEPNGARVDSSFGGANTGFKYIAKTSGTFTVLVSSDTANGTGNYTLLANGLVGGGKVSVPKISGANFAISGAGGTPNATVVLYSTTNLLTALNLWTPVSTNQFDQFGVFNSTNVHNLAQPQVYFRFAPPQN